MIVPKVDIVKLVPGVRAVTPTPASAIESVLLHVTPRALLRLESGVKNIWLLAVTALVFTVTVVAPVAMLMNPAAEFPQIAGERLEAQNELVSYWAAERVGNSTSLAPVDPECEKFRVLVGLVPVPRLLQESHTSFAEAEPVQ